MDEPRSDCKKPSNSSPEERKLQIQRCIQSLIHTCQCRDLTCQSTKCKRMKRVVQHTKGCKLKVNGNCPICKQLIALCFYHAKHCKDTKCTVPLCSSIKLKMKQPQVQQRLQVEILNRSMASMSISSEFSSEASLLDVSVQSLTNDLRRSIRISSVRRK